MIGSIELSFTMIALKFYALMNTEIFKICINVNVTCNVNVEIFNLFLPADMSK